MVLQIQLDKLKKLKISPSDFMLLEALRKGETEAVDYILENKYSNTLALAMLGYIHQNADGSPGLSPVYLKQFHIDSHEAWLDFQKAYPKKTPNRRRLQTHLEYCQRKYKEIVNNDLEYHKNILKCINLELLERRDSGSLEFFPMMKTYINEKRWESYWDDALTRESVPLTEEPSNNVIPFNRDNDVIL